MEEEKRELQDIEEIQARQLTKIKENQDARKKKRKKVTVLVLALLILLLGFGYCTFFHNPEPPNRFITGRGTEGFLPGMSTDQLMELLQREADENTISFNINARPVFPNGRSPGPLQIENPPFNLHYFEVEYHLVNEDGSLGQIIYSSGILPSNHHINMDRLDVALSRGEYRTIAVLTFYHHETQNLISVQQAEVIITVQN